VGDGTNALKTFDDAIKSDPTHVQSLHLRALCKHGLGLTFAAIEDFTTAVSVDRSHKGSIHMLGLCLQSTGRFHTALPHFKTLMQLDPSHVAFYNIEVTQYILEKMKE
jgi:lipoprotein NlpI